jgi:AraC-like DNA-binding protein
MISHRRSPAAHLAPFIRYYWYFEIGEDELPIAQMSFPYGSFELICYLENPNLMRWLGDEDGFVEPVTFYAGQLTRPYLMTFNKKCRCLGASLYPWAGSLVYRTPADEFTNQLIPLEALDGNAELHHQLMACNGEDALFDCIEAYLAQKLTGILIDPIACQLAGLIINNPDPGVLTRKLDSFGLSRRRIEQRFIGSTGLTLGMFTRKVRFQRAIQLLGKERNEHNLTSIGLQAGYYDQPHFINEFKAFSGLPPGEFTITGLNNFMKTLMMVG